MRKRKILLLGLSGILAFAAIIVVVPLIFKKQISSLIEREINNSLIADATFSDADVNLWRNFPHFTLTLDNFKLVGKTEFKKDTLLDVPELHVIFGTLQMIMYGEIEIRELNLISPNVHLVTLDNGKANYDIVRSDSTASENDDDIIMDIESCVITNGNLVYEDHSTRIVLKGKGVDMSGVVDVRDAIYNMNIRAGVQNFTSVYDNATYVQNKNISFDLEAAYDSKLQQLKFKDNEININQLKLAVEGMYAFNDEDQFFDIRFRSDDADFRDLLSLNDDLFSDNYKGIDIRGHVALEGLVKGTYNAAKKITPAFKVDMKVADGFVKYQELSSSINDIHFDLTAENSDSILDHTTIDIRAFSMKLGTNPLSGNLRISGFHNGHIKSDITANVKLKDLQDIYPMDGVAVDGKVDLKLTADGKYSGPLSRIHKHHATIVPLFNLDLHIKNGHFKLDSLPQAISDVHFHMVANNTTGVFENTAVKLEKIDATLGDNPIKGFVKIEGMKTPMINADIKGSLDLAEIKNFYPVDDLLLKGLFNIDMKVFGQWNQSEKKIPMVDAKVRIADAFIQSTAYPYAMEDTHLKLQAVNTTGNLRDTRIHIDTLTYTIEDENFTIEGYLMNLEKYSYHLNVKGKAYLEKLKNILQLDAFEKMEGEVDMDFKTSGNYKDLMEKNYHKLPTSGQVVLKNIVIGSKNLPHELNIQRGHFNFTNEKILLDTLHGSLGESSFNLSGHLYNYLAFVFHPEEKVKGDLLFASDDFDLHELMTKKASSDTLHGEISVIKVPENIEFTFDTNIKKLHYDNIVVDNLVGEVVMKDGVVTLAETNFFALDASFKMSGDYDTRDINHPLFDLNLEVTELDINKAHEAFATIQTVAPAADDTYGIFSVDYKIKGELSHNMLPIFESLDGEGTLRIREARVNGMKVFHHISGITKKEELKNPELKDIVMQTTVHAGIIYVKPFSMKLAGFDTDIEGHHNIHGDMNYIVKMALPPFDIVKIPLHVNGTYDNPKIHLGKGHEDALKKISEMSAAAVPSR